MTLTMIMLSKGICSIHITRESTINTYNFIFTVLEKKIKDANFSIWIKYGKNCSYDVFFITNATDNYNNNVRSLQY